MTAPTQAQIEAAKKALNTRGIFRMWTNWHDDMLHIALTAAQVGPVPGETLDDLRIIAAGLMADGIDVSKLSNIGKVELRQAIDRILALAATAQVGEAEDGIDYMLRKSIANRNATIECCALVCDELARAADSEDDAEMFRDTSTRIRALKDKP